MGLISRVSSRTYRKPKKNLNMTKKRHPKHGRCRCFEGFERSLRLRKLLFAKNLPQTVLLCLRRYSLENCQKQKYRRQKNPNSTTKVRQKVNKKTANII